MHLMMYRAVFGRLRESISRTAARISAVKRLAVAQRCQNMSLLVKPSNIICTRFSKESRSTRWYRRPTAWYFGLTRTHARGRMVYW